MTVFYFGTPIENWYSPKTLALCPDFFSVSLRLCEKESLFASWPATLLLSPSLFRFLQKCGMKGEEDFRPLFENFVQDLLTAVNKPEWPAAEVMLWLLGSLLISQFGNKSIDMSLRISSIDYLGIIASRLRKVGWGVKHFLGIWWGRITLKLVKCFIGK